MIESTLPKEEKIKEKIKEVELIVHKTPIDLSTAKNIVDREKTRFFAKLGFLKPKPEDIDCE